MFVIWQVSLDKLKQKGCYLGRRHIINGNTDFDGVFAVKGASTRLPRLAELFDEETSMWVNMEAQQVDIEAVFSGIVASNGLSEDEEEVPQQSSISGEKRPRTKASTVAAAAAKKPKGTKGRGKGKKVKGDHAADDEKVGEADAAKDPGEDPMEPGKVDGDDENA